MAVCHQGRRHSPSSLRFFSTVALGPQVSDWANRRWRSWRRSRSSSANVGAPRPKPRSSGCSATSGVAQAGYMAGRGRRRLRIGPSAHWSSTLGRLTLFMNLAAFAVIVARERETPPSATKHPRQSAALGAERPALAWPLTISMLALGRACRRRRASSASSILIEAPGRRQLHLARRLHRPSGTMISLAYYLKVVAADVDCRPRPRDRRPHFPANRRRPPPEAEPGRPRGPATRLYLVGPAIFRRPPLRSSSASFPQPLVDFASHAGASLF